MNKWIYSTPSVGILKSFLNAYKYNEYELKTLINDAPPIEPSRDERIILFQTGNNQNHFLNDS